MNTPDPLIYLGMVVEIWDYLGLDYATFSLFYSILSLFKVKYAFFRLFTVQILG